MSMGKEECIIHLTGTCTIEDHCLRLEEEVDRYFMHLSFKYHPRGKRTRSHNFTTIFILTGKGKKISFGTSITITGIFDVDLRHIHKKTISGTFSEFDLLSTDRVTFLNIIYVGTIFIEGLLLFLSFGLKLH